jgi:hypothetical protein
VAEFADARDGKKIEGKKIQVERFDGKYTLDRAHPSFLAHFLPQIFFGAPGEAWLILLAERS